MSPPMPPFSTYRPPVDAISSKHDCPFCKQMAEQEMRTHLAADKEFARLREAWTEAVESGLSRERQLQSELQDLHRQLHQAAESGLSRERQLQSELQDLHRQLFHVGESGLSWGRQLQSELQNVFEQLHHMEQTRSWRWTSIFRKCFGVFRLRRARNDPPPTHRSP